MKVASAAARVSIVTQGITACKKFANEWAGDGARVAEARCEYGSWKTFAGKKPLRFDLC